ncbi:phosphopantetheine-binding protein [Nocardia thailandica]|uniref:phosphopantetheine-binding protein n=1 Tax=Nocardia thailandica TaxID=257275 RepID=UPI0003056896|nr:phosphopantetheine-binding protein [Nocardia thailandica]
MTDTLPAKVRTIVASMAPVRDVEVDSGTRLIEDLGYHSLALLELAIELETQFELPGMDAGSTRGIVTVADVTALVAGLVQAPAPVDSEPVV